jgi:chloramphenicol-sensitive protein RarD
MQKGVLAAIGAYVLWGFLPIYWKFLHSVPALQIMTHRVVWSFIFLAILITIRREWEPLRTSLDKRTILIYLGAGSILAVNWLTYIWAVNANYIVETSLGYFINPLVSVVLGVIFLKERLRPLQWVPVGMAAVGVLYLSFNYGRLPWIALVLALSFGIYGLIKKLAPLGALHGLTVETGAVFIPSLGYLIAAQAVGVGQYGHGTPGQTVLLTLTGVVTAIPLLLFAVGARRIPLSMVGILQYIAPSIQFLIGVLLYKEPFTPARLAGFAIIWLALIVFTLEGFWQRRRMAQAAAA